VVRDHKLKGKQEGEAENLNTREHLLLLAMNEKGYKNLMRLASIASTEGFYYRPRVDDELLKTYADGLIATSACLGSRFSQMILRNDIDGCVEEIKKYMEIFQGRFFLEIQPTKEYLQKVVNHALLKISKQLNIPLVATSDAHYLLRSDSMTHDVLLA
jgi:DNA polymerase-3 subunit alpha